VKSVREGPTGQAAAYIAQITVNDVSFMKKFHTWHLSTLAVDTKPSLGRTRCNFAEKSYMISVRISLNVLSYVPVLHPRIDLQSLICEPVQIIVAVADTTY
jgi:hypothetical protein